MEQAKNKEKISEKVAKSTFSQELKDDAKKQADLAMAKAIKMQKMADDAANPAKKSKSHLERATAIEKALESADVTPEIKSMAKAELTARQAEADAAKDADKPVDPAAASLMEHAKNKEKIYEDIAKSTFSQEVKDAAKKEAEEAMAKAKAA